jgi:hypothetical protein
VKVQNYHEFLEKRRFGHAQKEDPQLLYDGWEQDDSPNRQLIFDFFNNT